MACPFYLSHNLKLQGHEGERRMYDKIQKHFTTGRTWQMMCIHLYANLPHAPRVDLK